MENRQHCTGLTTFVYARYNVESNRIDFYSVSLDLTIKHDPHEHTQNGRIAVYFDDGQADPLSFVSPSPCDCPALVTLLGNRKTHHTARFPCSCCQWHVQSPLEREFCPYEYILFFFIIILYLLYTHDCYEGNDDRSFNYPLDVVLYNIG